VVTRRKWLIVPLLALLALVFATAVVGASPAPQAGPPDFVEGEILVKFKPGTPGALVSDTHRQNGAQVKEVIPGIDVQVLGVPAGQEHARVAAYSRNPNVLFAEVNGFYYVVWSPNDQHYGSQWQYTTIQAPEAWDLHKGINTVRVAVLDTGIDRSHQDLQGKVVNAVNFTTSRFVDDRHGHGTHVAGSVSAATNNSIGVAGTAPFVKLDSVKVLSDTGSGSWSGIANGIMWAADHGSKVINLSLGGTSSSSTLENAVNYAWGKGVVVVAAAGNNGNTTLFYPAAYGNVIAVAATNSSDSKASWSNYGTWVDVAAPGVNILSTVMGNKYEAWGGTSMASPHVAGLAALLFSAKPGATAGEVRSLIQNNADAITGTGTTSGSLWKYGRINAYRSLLPLVPVAAPTGLTAAGGNAKVDLGWNASSGATSYKVYRSTTSGTGYSHIGTTSPGTATSYSDTSVTNGTTYYYVVKAANSAGESGYSDEASATPTGGTMVPAAPTGLTAAGGNAKVDLSWNASSGATSYKVYRSTTSGTGYSHIGTTSPGTATSYSDTSVTNGTTYYYVVKAVNTAGESGYSNQVSATPKAPKGSKPNPKQR
jgi:thermitase